MLYTIRVLALWLLGLAGSLASGLFLATLASMTVERPAPLSLFVLGTALSSLYVMRGREGKVNRPSRIAGRAFLLLAIEGIIYPWAGLFSMGVVPAYTLQPLPEGPVMVLYRLTEGLKVGFGMTFFLAEPLLALLAYWFIRRSQRELQ